MSKPSVIVLSLCIWNMVVFALYGLDKHKAKCRAQRISERTLLLSAAFMGGLGAFAGMYLFRHKTKHTKFKVCVPLFLALNIAVVVLCAWN